MFRGMVKGRGNWVRDSEHIVLRLVSLAFSVGSAYAVRWFFEPLDANDAIHYALFWVVAAGFGLLGFYLSRSLTHRMMSKEPIWAYAPIFLLVEFFEILCNYAKAVSAVAGGNVSWVAHAPVGQQTVMIVLTYIGWSILPLVSPAMAVADMDMTRRRNGETVSITTTTRGLTICTATSSCTRTATFKMGQPKSKPTGCSKASSSSAGATSSTTTTARGDTK